MEGGRRKSAEQERGVSVLASRAFFMESPVSGPLCHLRSGPLVSHGVDELGPTGIPLGKLAVLLCFHGVDRQSAIRIVMNAPAVLFGQHGGSHARMAFRKQRRTNFVPMLPHLIRGKFLVADVHFVDQVFQSETVWMPGQQFVLEYVDRLLRVWLRSRDDPRRDGTIRRYKHKRIVVGEHVFITRLSEKAVYEPSIMDSAAGGKCFILCTLFSIPDLRARS